jgi:oligopeptidase B
MKPPIAKKIPFTVERHGLKREDEYRWLKDENWKKICDNGVEEFANSEILDYVKAENEYTQHTMADTKDLQQELYDELLSRINEDDVSVPHKDGPYFYYSRTEKGKNYPIKCRKKAGSRAELEETAEEIWMDVNKDAEASGSEQYSLGACRISPDHNWVAYAVNTTGSLNYSIRVRNLITGAERDWQIDDVTESMRWANNNRHVFFVTRHPENGRGYEVKLLDTQSGAVFPIYVKPERFSSMFMYLSKTATEQWVKIHVGDHVSNEIHLMNADCPENYRRDNTPIHMKPELITALEANVQYDFDHFGDKLYVHTNKDAVNFKVMVTSLDMSGVENWEEFIPHQENVYIEGTSVYQTPDGVGYFARQVTDTEQALPGVVIRNLETGKEHVLEMPEEAYDLSFSGSMEFVTQKVIYTYQSPVQPTQIIELDLDTKDTEILKTREAPNYDASLYATQRRFAESHDGVRIPMTIMFKKDTVLDGLAPAFVYAYGSYGSGMTAYFSAARISLLDRGFVFAIAHVRGGDDRGYNWYLDGKLAKKKNTFLDFISCCEHLAKKGYTSEGNIVANGGSAGGLLMGAIANMRPDLFKAIVADVAFVDLMNTMEDTSLPLTESEWNEWGNPIEDKEAYEYMLSYSPYDNVEAKDYPHLLFNSGISDEQVTYWEPTKMVARLRDKKTDDNMLLLKMKMTAGHGGASKRYESYRNLAFDYAFCLKAAGLVGV